MTATSYVLIAGTLAMSIMSQNLIPVHIAFIPLLIPPLLTVMNRLKLDRRLIACVLTFESRDHLHDVAGGFRKDLPRRHLVGQY